MSQRTARIRERMQAEVERSRRPPNPHTPTTLERDLAVPPSPKAGLRGVRERGEDPMRQPLWAETKGTGRAGGALRHKVGLFWLTVGNSAAMRGFGSPYAPAGNFGELAPRDYFGFEVWLIGANVSSNLVQLTLGRGGDTGPPDFSPMTVRIEPDGSETTLNWNTSSRRYQNNDPAFTTALAAQLGNTIRLYISPNSAQEAGW